MKEELKKVGDTLAEIVQKLGDADKAVLEPYVKQMNDALDSLKKSGQDNMQAALTQMLEATEKIKTAKVGDLPGFTAGIDMIQSILKKMASK